MRILGLDPGTATTGYGIIDAIDGRLQVVTYGVILTSARDSAPQRLQTIYQELNQLIATYQPNSAAIEEVFFGRNITTAISVGQARGVLILALANAGIPIAEYSPPRIKDAVTGYGKANKAQVQLMVRNLLDLEETPRPDDAADGLAIAITHYQYQRFESLYD
ncbi:MAG: crossover junction endodeoxyribonuclease RuvC [Anaerolineales bacterium]|nr:crossover junction endodeoxyribonuclease RuvC [Anaerolineales bacterium]MCA9974550.1 crossover junction endodeoxyribonuclease RuvC [Anaerolineales bacterium]MCB8966334.1 crossover junction endodeoxyribonuclease RuvC [Ardenticatenaceae bacterium]